MELFYVRPENVSEHELILDDFERKHILSTLRKNINDPLWVTDGQGGVYKGIIRQTAPRLIVEIAHREQKTEPKPTVTLACGFIKQNRMDFILEKGTELGVGRFVFFRSRFANYFSPNTDRLYKVVRQALKQSLRFYLPEIKVYSDLDRFFADDSGEKTRFVAIDSGYPLLRALTAGKTLQGESSVIIAIGPEGGFSAEEVAQFNDNGFEGFSLGPQRLRTETAAIAAAAIVGQYIH